MTLRALVGVDWAKDEKGALTTRQAFCRCGKEYTQVQLSEAYLALMTPGIRAAHERQCPGGWVPTNCPPCEHVALGADSRAGESVARRNTSADDRRYEIEERRGLALV